MTSPFLFKIFYYDLVEKLAAHEGGINIGGNFNIICYADDILLASTTSSGLQKLIDSAVQYVELHGLRFNANKTNCFIIGNNPFVSTPKWYINNCELEIRESINYLGATIGNKCSTVHTGNRVSACRKAFCSLQGAGLCNNGVSTDTGVHVWSATCKSILQYGCQKTIKDR